MVKPFLKWLGGKRWLTPYISDLLQTRTFERYFEPFLGGGAIFFGIQPKIAVLSDVNADLVNTYNHVKMQPHELIEQLKNIPVNKETYLRMRETMPIDPLERSVRFLYLNRTAFNGIYRLSQDGRFNVPFGGGDRTPESLWKENLLINASKALQDSRLLAASFEEVITSAGKDDFIYCDPTYTVSHNNNGFVRYNEKNFSWDDQKRLACVCREAADRGAIVFVSNAYHQDVAELYRDAEMHIVERNSLVSALASKRQRVKEYLFVLEPQTRVSLQLASQCVILPIN